MLIFPAWELPASGAGGRSPKEKHFNSLRQTLIVTLTQQQASPIAEWVQLATGFKKMGGSALGYSLRFRCGVSYAEARKVNSTIRELAMSRPARQLLLA